MVKFLFWRASSAMVVAGLLGQPIAAAAYRDPCYPQASCPNAPATGSGSEAPSRQYPSSHDDGHDDGDHTGAAIAGLIALIGAAVLVDGLTGKKWASRSTLDEQGPRFPEQQAVGKFQAQGYARDGWPVVVDLETQPGTTTWLEIRTKGGDKAQKIVIPGEGRRVEVLRTPYVGAYGGVAVARYTVQSGVIGPDGKLDHRPMAVYGIGAGPRAVGSMTIQVTRFDPAVAASPDAVNYALLSRRLFDRSTVEFLRLPPPNKSKLALVRSEKLFPLTPGTHAGDWRSLNVRPAPASGMYLLQARAWLVGASGDARDWTGAFAPNYVRIP